MATHQLEGLKPIREELGVKVTDLAKRLGCTPVTYYRYENGKRRIFFDQALAIASMLGVNVEWLQTIPDADRMLEVVRLGSQRRLDAIEATRPAPPVTLLPRPTMREGGGLTQTTRPCTDSEIRQLGLDPINYAALPPASEQWAADATADLEHHDPNPEVEAIHRAGDVMGDEAETLERLKVEWGD